MTVVISVRGKPRYVVKDINAGTCIWIDGDGQRSRGVISMRV
jgi:hypothetical protein